MHSWMESAGGEDLHCLAMDWARIRCFSSRQRAYPRRRSATVEVSFLQLVKRATFAGRGQGTTAQCLAAHDALRMPMHYKRACDSQAFCHHGSRTSGRSCEYTNLLRNQPLCPGTLKSMPVPARKLQQRGKLFSKSTNMNDSSSDDNDDDDDDDEEEDGDSMGNKCEHQSYHEQPWPWKSAASRGSDRIRFK